MVSLSDGEREGTEDDSDCASVGIGVWSETGLTRVAELLTTSKLPSGNCNSTANTSSFLPTRQKPSTAQKERQRASRRIWHRSRYRWGAVSVHT